MVQSLSYDSITERILTHYEELAEMNGQEGAYELYEMQMETSSKFREGLKKFKENYQINNHSNMSFLPEFFKIMETEYGCDNAEFLRWLLPSYVQFKTKEKELIEQELSKLDVFKAALEERN